MSLVNPCPKIDINLTIAYSQEGLPFSAAEHLDGIMQSVPDYDERIPFGMWIGGNCWCIIESISSDVASSLKCNCVQTSD